MDGQIRQAWHILAAGAPQAARTLVELSGGARSEFVRAQASVAILDRVGLGTVESVVVDIDGDREDRRTEARETARAVLAARMAALGATVTVPGEVLGAPQGDAEAVDGPSRPAVGP